MRDEHLFFSPTNSTLIELLGIRFQHVKRVVPIYIFIVSERTSIVSLSLSIFVHTTPLLPVMMTRSAATRSLSTLAHVFIHIYSFILRSSLSLFAFSRPTL